MTDTNAQEATRRAPGLGEPGYAMVIDAAFAAGHITPEELRTLQRVSSLIARRASRIRVENRLAIASLRSDVA